MTPDYYDEHAEEFFSATASLDMRELYEPFLSRLPRGGRILDAGCGSGRDSLAFKRLGYRVTAFDASARLAGMASELIGQPVLNLAFQDLAFHKEFDGVWACASLLHVPRAEIDDVFERLARALRPSGVLYASFKCGDSEEVRSGRFFNSYDEMAFAALVARHRDLEAVRVWMSEDVRPGRTNERWLNAILEKRPFDPERPCGCSG